MNRNLFWLITAILLFSIHRAEAQPQPKIWKIGVLVSGSRESNAARDRALRQGLRDFGYEEGKNIVLNYRFANGKLNGLRQLAHDLVEDKPDVIVVGGTAVAVAAKKATNTIPIVIAGAGDLVEAGLIKSYMYPGGNVTGVGRLSADFFDSRMDLIKKVLPKATLISILSNPKNPGHTFSLRDVELSVRSSGLSFHSATAQSATELDAAIAGSAKVRSNVLLILTDPLFSSRIPAIAQAALQYRLPAMYDRADFIEAGGLMSYGANLSDLTRRAAEYVDQIIKGNKPSDLTLVQPTKFDLAINLKIATRIGLTIPPNVLARADKVIK